LRLGALSRHQRYPLAIGIKTLMLYAGKVFFRVRSPKTTVAIAAGR
jgi:hypothetical protein